MKMIQELHKRNQKSHPLMMNIMMDNFLQDAKLYRHFKKKVSSDKPV